MSGIPFWAVEGGQDGATYMDTEWDLLFTAGSPIPGITECTGVPERKADKQSPAGKNGGPPVLHGRKPATFETATRLWTPQQWIDWQIRQEDFWPKGGTGTVKAVDLAHPYLASVQIAAGIAQSVSGPIPTGVQGERVVKVKWEEFRVASKKSATKRPIGSVATRQEFNGLQSRAAADGTEIPPPENQLQSLPSDNASFMGP